MNIDRQKFKESVDRGDFFNKSIMQILDDCEVKKPKPEQNELDNLFIGAPVMSKNDVFNKDAIWVLGKVRDTNMLDLIDNIRLPTVEELIDNGWVNKWFAPWVEMPEKLMLLHVLLRIKTIDPFVIRISELENSAWSWGNVEAIMILGDFKYEG